MCGLTDLRMFVEIERSNSMSVAAARLGMSPATISGRLKSLEEHFGVTLIRRTTRSLALTEEGRLLLHHATDLIAGFDALESELRGRKRSAEGALVISAPAEFGSRWIVMLAHRFAAANPDVELHIQLDAAGSAVAPRGDVAFRIGQLPPSIMTTRKLAETGYVTCAAPSYLAAHGTPMRPAELRDHDCLLLSGDFGPEGGWSYVQDGRRTTVPLAGRRTASDIDLLVELSRLGHGIVHVHRWTVADSLADGSLVPLLEPFEPGPEPVHLLSESRKLLPLRTIRFIDFVKGHFRREESLSNGWAYRRELDAPDSRARVCA